LCFRPPDAAEAAAVVQQLKNECVYTAGVVSNGIDISNIITNPNFVSNLNSPDDVQTVVNGLLQQICL
jgi:hypothetical protein